MLNMGRFREWACCDWQRQRDLLPLSLWFVVKALHCPSNEFCMHRRAAGRSRVCFVVILRSSNSTSSPFSIFRRPYFGGKRAKLQGALQTCQLAVTSDCEIRPKVSLKMWKILYACICLSHTWNEIRFGMSSSYSLFVTMQDSHCWNWTHHMQSILQTFKAMPY